MGGGKGGGGRGTRTLKKLPQFLLKEKGLALLLLVQEVTKCLRKFSKMDFKPHKKTHLMQ